MTRCSWLVAAALLAGGCAATRSGTLNGEVTLDGANVKEGVVSFFPADGKGATGTANIADGKFRATLAVGEYRVQFSAPKPGAKRKVYDTPDSPLVEDVGELIPDKYNAKSDLKVTIQTGSQEKRFELTTK